jgi:hypothetical protein
VAHSTLPAEALAKAGPFEPQLSSCYNGSIMMHSYNSYSWWGSAPFFGLGSIGVLGMIVLAIFLLAEIALKGYALWYAAKRSEKWWFIAILIINTAGILEIVYLVFFVKKWHRRLKPEDRNRDQSSQ